MGERERPRLVLVLRCDITIFDIKILGTVEGRDIERRGCWSGSGEDPEGRGARERQELEGRGGR